MKDAIIVGAGIAGLTLAYYLRRAGADVAVLDQGHRPGGVICTEHFENYLLEHGPNSVLSNDELLQLAADLNIERDLLYPSGFAKKRFLAVPDAAESSGYRLQAAPAGLFDAIRTPILSLRGKLRIAGEPFVKKGHQDDESVFSFASRRFGGEAADLLFGAMLSGIWASDINSLSARSALPTLWDLEREFGSVAVSALRRVLSRRQNRKRHKRRLVTFSEGMGFLASKLSDSLGESVMISSASVTGIYECENGWRVEYSQCQENSPKELLGRKVVLAVPALETAALIKHFDQVLSEKIAAIPYAPLGVIHVGLKRAAVGAALDGFGFLVAPTFGKALLGAIFSSSIFADRAPADSHLITCFVGGASKPELADVTQPDVQARAIGELTSFLRAKAGPQVLRANYWPRAIPNYPLRHYQTEIALSDFEREHPNLQIIGNWRRGISVADRIREGRELAERIIPSRNN